MIATCRGMVTLRHELSSFTGSAFRLRVPWHERADLDLLHNHRPEPRASPASCAGTTKE